MHPVPPLTSCRRLQRPQRAGPRERRRVRSDGPVVTVRKLLARPGYRRLWLARTASQAGDVAQFATLGLLLLALTGSGLGVSGAVVAEVLPVLLLGPLAGNLVDRPSPASVMFAADVWRAVLAAVLAVWHSDAPVAYAVAAGLSAGAVFFNSSAACTRSSRTVRPCRSRSMSARSTRRPHLCWRHRPGPPWPGPGAVCGWARTTFAPSVGSARRPVPLASAGPCRRPVSRDVDSVVGAGRAGLPRG